VQAIVSDHAAINQMRAERTEMFKREQMSIEHELRELQEDMTGCLRDLEQQYFMSKYRLPVLEVEESPDPLYEIAMDVSLT
jgi:hypothetical protein